MSVRRVLHVVRCMAHGGVETWLMHVMRRIDPQRVQLDFLVHVDQRCAYDEEIEAHGRRILRCCEPLGSPGYAVRISRLLEANGPYDVVHSHVHHFSGYLLRLAKNASVRQRIAHSHNDTSVLDERCGIVRKGYLRLMKHWIGIYSTGMVAASRPAGACLFGRNWVKDSRSQVLYCGIDLNRFPQGDAREAARERVRAKWNVSREAFVIGHVGRFDPQKNHEFLVHVAAEAMRRNPEARLVLVGDGQLRNAIRERAARLGIEKQVVFAGVCQDVPEAMAGMDVFVFPSLHEGLGVALVEAQAAGLPCVISDVVPGEADVVPELVQRVNLQMEPAAWAFALGRAATPIKHDEALNQVRSSRLNLEKSLEQLYALYRA